MFGWLASFGVHSRARSTTTVRWLAITPRTLLEGLGQLGGVLYLAPSFAASCQADLPSSPGCLVESADLAPLLSTRYVGVTCAVTCEGPREWIDCIGADGETLARIYLLPDTDYLAWDGLFVDALPIDGPPCRLPDRDGLRGCRARVLSFSRRRLGGFDMLSATDVCISVLGRGVARDIAVSESIAIGG
ncbi:hypothetical protein [Luteibacter sp. CQ10]|uniref:hypothetical protein n=1 Tax=Luteibacter sp. CQ10 TaxID=2805821 RepID=UPI0034A0D929